MFTIILTSLDLQVLSIITVGSIIVAVGLVKIMDHINGRE